MRSTRRPHILWITLEDTSPRFGCTGDPVARTPCIDRLAGEGRRYPLAFATAAVCAPSRTAVITGMYATAIGAQHHRTTTSRADVPELPTPYAAVPPPHVKTLGEWLRRAGYFCSNNAKTDYQFPTPFTAWDACGPHAHWRQRAPDQPFFAVFNLDVTHESGMWENGHTPSTDPAAVPLPPYLPDTPRVRGALARHYDNLAAADRRVGQLLAELAAAGLAQDTVVFLWSDHGEGLPRGKSWLYDSGIRVPLIVRWPGVIAPGEVAEDLVSLVDLAPTVLSLAGVPLPHHLQGQPFLGEGSRPRTYVFAARDRHDEMADMVRAVRDRRYKYIWNAYPELPYMLWNAYRHRHPAAQELWRLHAAGRLEGPARALFGPGRPCEELYDTVTDPHEIRNLANDPAYRPVLERLRAVLAAWRVEHDPLAEEPETVLAARTWPERRAPETAAPLFIPIADGRPGLEPTPEGAALPFPALLLLACATQGASIAYTFDPGDDARWRLYREPLRLPPGVTTVRARASRLGYADSEERRAVFTVAAAVGIP
jgi:N-sulfoglucosamine sulfohydrolase